jgi:hypothetical protein
MIKTFRGQLGDGEQETIRLGTNKGLMGYKINKFQLMPDAPGTVEHELVCKIYKYKQDTIDGNVNFDDGTLLGVSIMMAYAPTASITTTTTIFDNVVFNQDIYVTAIDMESSSKTNYYIELEQIKLSGDEAAVATLKDMRGS